MSVVGLLIRRSWQRWSPLVSGQLLAWRRVPLVLLMPLARMLQVLYQVMPRVG